MRCFSRALFCCVSYPARAFMFNPLWSVDGLGIKYTTAIPSDGWTLYFYNTCRNLYVASQLLLVVSQFLSSHEIDAGLCSLWNSHGIRYIALFCAKETLCPFPLQSPYMIHLSLSLTDLSIFQFCDDWTFALYFLSKNNKSHPIPHSSLFTYLFYHIG